MEKILFVADSGTRNWNVIDFACYVAALTHSGLTGAFVEKFNYEQPPFTDEPETFLYDEAQFTPFHQEGGSLVVEEESISRFKEACKKKGVSCRVQQDLSLRYVLKESRFYDIIIVDPRVAGERTGERVPSQFVKNLLLMAECPVIIAPENHAEISEIIHCYDGSKSAVFAIKQFTYLFPELLDMKCILLQVNDPAEGTLEERDEMKQWLKSHYLQCGSETLHGVVANELHKFLESRKNAIVTMGAYGRNVLSTMLKESRANRLISMTKLPLFISHK